MKSLNGTTLDGRKLKLELGVKKERLTKKDREAAAANKATESASTPAKEVKPANEPKPAKESKKPAANTVVKDEEKAEEEEFEDGSGHIKKSRQILVFGVPVDISKKAFKMAMSKISKKSEVELIKEVCAATLASLNLLIVVLCAGE